MELKNRKKDIRKAIADIKKRYSLEWRVEASKSVMARVETLDIFNNSDTILLYHALPDEVQTASFLNRWYGVKRLVLPVVCGDDLVLRVYNPASVSVGYCSIPEPTEAADEVAPCDIDLAIIPGVAFDISGNRLGRGRGFYDRLLPALDCELIGLGFDYQIVDCVPMESFDRKLSKVITETNIF